MIPILGCEIAPAQNLRPDLKENIWRNVDLVEKMAEADDKRLCYLVQISTKTIVCCKPGTLSGLSIAGFFNEPSPGEISNCVLHKGFLVTTQLVPKGTELTWLYGQGYVRRYQIGSGPRTIPRLRLPISRTVYKKKFSIQEKTYNGHFGVSEFLSK